MVEDNDDTTDLSDDALRNRLRRLRGDAEQPPPPAADAPLSSMHTLPDLHVYGMRPLELTVHRNGVYDAIQYDMSVHVETQEAVDRILASMRAGDALHVPAMFPMLRDAEAVVTDYDSGTRKATFRAVMRAEEAAAYE